jgi:hypothetical protein
VVPKSRKRFDRTRHCLAVPSCHFRNPHIFSLVAPLLDTIPATAISRWTKRITKAHRLPPCEFLATARLWHPVLPPAPLSIRRHLRKSYDSIWRYPVSTKRVCCSRVRGVFPNLRIRLLETALVASGLTEPTKLRPKNSCDLRQPHGDAAWMEREKQSLHQSPASCGRRLGKMTKV